MKHAFTTLGMIASLVLTGCIDYLEPGQFGKPRYVDNMRGETPMRLVPPISDRDGNSYVLYGSPDFTTTVARVGYATGGWKKGCNGHRGDGYGLHGWVGRGQDRAWYWSGDALVEISASGTGCNILIRDAATRASFRYLGVLPMVKAAPSRTTTVALVIAEGDSRPFILVVDLLRSLYKTNAPFEPENARDLTVIGVGATPGMQLGYMVLRYVVGDETLVEARYIDSAGRTLRRVPLLGLEDMPAYSVRGYLQSVDGRRVVGALENGDIVSFDTQGGGVLKRSVEMEVAGVHPADGDLYLVGTSGSHPAIAKLDSDGKPIKVEPWLASLAAHDALYEKRIKVLDDRGKPALNAVWPSPTSAIGPFPFVSPFPPEYYAEGTTSWLIAGPTYRAGGDIMTAVAFLPMGITYP